MVGELTNKPLTTIKQIIRQSNQNSASGKQQYVFWENKAIQNDYDFVTCECTEECWCKKNGCSGHYIIKDISFEQFLDTYVHLWIPPRARDNVKNAVLFGSSFKGRQKNAIPPLELLKDYWQVVINRVRSHNKCGLCDCELPMPIKTINIGNLYDAKIWSQLFYDTLVPFDTKSQKRIAQNGYTDPIEDYMQMNRELFHDLRVLSSLNNLSVVEIRRLDTPWKVDTRFKPIENGQPLSRILDKIFYSP